MCKVQRLSREGVQHKSMMLEAVSTQLSDDIVSSIWKHIAVHKRTGRVLRAPSKINVIFGMSAPSFVEYAYVNYGVIFTLEEAKAIKTAYQKQYPGITRYAKARWNDYKTQMVQTPLGRRNKARLGTDAINYATQGCIAETMKLAIHYLCKDYPMAIKYIYNVIHDAAYLRVPKGEESIWASKLLWAMNKGWVEMCKRPMLFYKDIPMPIELEFNDYSSGEAVYRCIETTTKEKFNEKLQQMREV